MPRHPLFQSGLAWVAVATFAMAFKGIFARLIYQQHVGVNALLVWRFALAVPLFWLGARWVERGKTLPSLTRGQWLGCAGTGVLFFVSAWSDFHAIDALGASLSRLVLYTFPALIMVMQALEARRMPSRAHLLTFSFAWVGIGMLLLPGWQGGDVSPAGIAYGFGAATCYALFWRSSQKLMKQLGSVRFNRISNSFTLVCMSALLLPALPVGALSVTPTAFGWLLLLVIISTVLPFFVLFEGLSRVNATEAGVVSMFGPVITVSLATGLFPDERLNWIQWAGMALVLISVGSLSLRRRTRPATA